MIIKPIARRAVQTGVKLAASSTCSRRFLNRCYLRLSHRYRWHFWRLFSDVFRDARARQRAGFWKVSFAGAVIDMPLTMATFGLDWVNAVSITGHDIDVKETYEAILLSPDDRPDLFIDVGGNFGTHSLLFLIQGIRTITFEPNRACHPYFLEVCRLNKLQPALESVALG